METIKDDILSENIRQNWSKYKNEIYNTPDYELLWDNWANKFEIDKTDIFYIILKKFINNEEISLKKPKFQIFPIDEKTMMLKGLSGFERKELHSLCDKIGLHHKSKSNPKNHKSRFFYIYKPKIWLWEYTVKNPYSKSDEYYKQKDIEYQIKQEKYNERLRRKYCCMCQKNALETELFCSVYIRGFYCNDCIETTCDDNGDELSGHKFEPIYI